MLLYRLTRLFIRFAKNHWCLVVVFGALLAFSLVAATPNSSIPQADFYVAPKGNDANAGTATEPFATLARARDAVRQKLSGNPNHDILVFIRGGRYELREPLIFGPQDSGTEQLAVVYQAYPGEKPVISGGRIISGWKTGSGQIWTADVPETKSGAWYFRSLYIDGKRAIRARIPNRDAAQPYYHLTGAVISPQAGQLKLAPGQIQVWQSVPEIEAVVLGNWEITRRHLLKVNPEASELELAPPYLLGNSAIRPRAGMACYLENALEFLDQAGEWYLNRQTGVLSYWPLPGQDMTKSVAIAPVQTNLLRIHGDAGHPVRNLHFVGLSFNHTDWPLPPQGYNGVQACAFFNPGENTDPDNYWSGRMDAALEWEFAIDCTLERGQLAHLGGVGLSLRTGCRNNTLQRNEIQDISGNGLTIGENWTARYYDNQPPPPPAEVPTNNHILNQHIHNCGVDYPGAVGIWISFTDGTLIAHNDIHDLPYTGISVGWYWGTKPTACRNNRVEFNHIFNVMKLLADGGGIYTLGVQPGTVLRGNLIHDIERSPFAVGGAPNNGIFFDEGSQGFTVADNLIYRTSGDPVRFNANKKEGHIWQNNSFGINPESDAFPCIAAARAGIQNDPAIWEKDIRAFELADQAQPPAKGAILFIGSSSIRMWKSLAADFPGLTVLQRGFGGSQIPDSTAFIDRIVVPYQPKIVVLYAGDNDLAANRAPEQVVGDFREFVARVHARLPATRMAFIAIKPSLARWHLIDKIKQANDLIRQYCQRETGLQFIDIFPAMLNVEGKPRPELFAADGLHLNIQGYALWTKTIRPYLE